VSRRSATTHRYFSDAARVVIQDDRCVAASWLYGILRDLEHNAMSSNPTVWVFFYGTFVNPEVCARANAELRDVELTRLAGFDIRIGPLANLVRSDQHIVYGVIARMNHTELGRLYSMDWVGTYLPEAVLVESQHGRLIPALTYLKPVMEPAPADDAYIDRIIDPGRRYGFPQWYLDRLDSFRASRRDPG